MWHFDRVWQYGSRLCGVTLEETKGGFLAKITLVGQTTTRLIKQPLDRAKELAEEFFELEQDRYEDNYETEKGLGKFKWGTDDN